MQLEVLKGMHALTCPGQVGLLYVSWGPSDFTSVFLHFLSHLIITLVSVFYLFAFPIQSLAEFPLFSIAVILLLRVLPQLALNYISDCAEG